MTFKTLEKWLTYRRLSEMESSGVRVYGGGMHSPPVIVQDGEGPTAPAHVEVVRTAQIK